jgi:hypothetical protein
MGGKSKTIRRPKTMRCHAYQSEKRQPARLIAAAVLPPRAAGRRLRAASAI